MTDRELLEALRRQQAELEQSLSRINLELQTLEARTRNGSVPPPPPVVLPPVPRDVVPPPAFPPVPPPPAFPPVPQAAGQLHPGRWLTRLGAVFGFITLLLILSLTHVELAAVLGPAGLFGLSGALCLGAVVLAQRWKVPYVTGPLLSIGLAGLYLTLDLARDSVIRSPAAGGLLLLAWSLFVFLLAERRNSQPLAVFALALAYVSMALDPSTRFGLSVDLLLGAAGAGFLLYRSWAATAYVGLFGTYLAMGKWLLVAALFEPGRIIPFAPCAVYLLMAWLVFSAAALIPTLFASRTAFLGLNNAALTVLLTFAACLAGYPAGWTLFWIGAAFLVLWALGSRASFEPIGETFLAHGLAVFTLGLIGITGGMARGFWLLGEALLLGFLPREIFRIAAGVAAVFATLFLGWEISVYSHHPWILGPIGAVVLLVIGWMRRIKEPVSFRSRFVPAAAGYCALAIGLVFLTLAVKLSGNPLLIALALSAAILTFAVSFPELQLAAQFLLLAAQWLVLFPSDTGEPPPGAGIAWVAVITVALLAWWSRPRAAQSGWIMALKLLYALALVGLAGQALQPGASGPGWLIGASFLSAAFLVVGALARVWPLAAMGQLFLAVAVVRFYFPGDPWFPFPWSWWQAAVPVATVFATARLARAWLDDSPETLALARRSVGFLIRGYQLLTLAMLMRLLFGLEPLSAQPAAFLFLGTLLVGWNAPRGNAFAVRCGFVPGLIGIFLVASRSRFDPAALPDFLNGLAIFSLLIQPALLRHAPRRLVSGAENWLLVLLSAATGWLFVDAWAALHAGFAAVAWLLYALFLFLLGLLMEEPRQRRCGLAILVVALARLFLCDIWGFSNAAKVSTLVLLTITTFGLGSLYARYTDRLKTWL